MIFQKGTLENWNMGMEDVGCTEEFAKANQKENETYYVKEGENKAIVLIKKRFIRILSRAQVFTNSTNREFLEKIIDKLKKMNIPYARIGNTMFGISKEIILKNSKSIERHTFIINLENKKEEIWNNFNKKLRNAIRKAEKEGVIINEIKNEDELKKYYDLSLQTEKNIQKNKGRKTFNIQKYNFFKELWTNKIGRFLVARYNGEFIAGALFLLWKNKSIYFQSFSSRKETNKQAPSLIQWGAIKRFKEEGIKEYDLGGVTLGLNEKDSRFFIYEFKRKFGGKLRKFYNIEIELNKFKKLQDNLIGIIYGNKI